MKNLMTGLLVLIASPLYSQTQPLISGTWDTGRENTKVEISEGESGVLSGIIRSSDNSKVETGLIMLKNLEKLDGTWKGKIYSLKRKEWFDVEIKLNGDQLMLEVSNRLFTRSIEWKRSN
jgi:uncharacterized protein (DUF2147 family)